MFGKALRTAGSLALAAFLATTAPASTDPTFGDLSTGDLPVSALSEIKGPDLFPALGNEYRPLVLMGALENLEQSIRDGQPISREVQDVLQAHADQWRAAYSNQLAGSDDFDAALEAVLDEQGQDGPGRVAAYGSVSRELQALADAAIRYNLATSLNQFGAGDGYRTISPRDPGSVGLDSAGLQKLRDGYVPNLASQMQLRAREIQEILKS